MTKRVLIFAVPLVLLVSLGNRAFAQDSKINELRQRYTWGSIYFAYDPICDLIYDLKDPKKHATISAMSGATLLTEFLKRNTAQERVKSISFLQINLQNLSAGYMKASDRDGVIKPLQWTKEQVRDVAILCDRLLTVGIAFEKLKDRIIAGNIGLTEAWIGLSVLSREVLVPVEKLALLFVAYGTLLRKIEVHEAAPRGIIRELRNQFDQTIAARNWPWSEKFMDWYYESPQNNLLLEQLKADYGAVFRAMDMTVEAIERSVDPDIIDWYAAEVSLAQSFKLDYATRYKQALKYMTKAAEVDPNNPEILTVIAKVYLAQSSLQQARIFAERALKFDPHRADIHLLLGKIYLEQGMSDAAVASFQAALVRDDKLIEAHLLLAQLFIGRNQTRVAAEHLNKVLSIDPKNAEASRVAAQLSARP